MSAAEPCGFLARWSRRKAARQAQATPEPPLPNPPPNLPPVETLGADSDYTAFLARGVSAPVQAQALRVAWRSDPAIANFRGMAEYAWDFNAPDYGAMAATDDVSALVSQVTRAVPPQLVAALTELPLPECVLPGHVSPELALPEPAPALVASPAPLPEQAAAPPRPVMTRRHGGALPA
jgi:hypothetical protein